MKWKLLYWVIYWGNIGVIIGFVFSLLKGGLRAYI